MSEFTTYETDTITDYSPEIDGLGADFSDFEIGAPDAAPEEKAIPLESIDKPISFSFHIGGRLFSETYETRDFCEFDRPIRLLLAIGQSSSFIKTGPEQMDYVGRLVNKNMVNGSRVSHKQIERLVFEVTEQGLVDSDDGLLKPTEKARPLLETRSRWQAGHEDESAEEPDVLEEMPAIEAELLPPVYELPDKKSYDYAKSTGVRELEVLAELELLGGRLVSAKPHIAVKQLIGQGSAEPLTYRKSLERLAGKGVLEVETFEDGTTSYTISDLGKQLVGYIKAKPELLGDKERRGKLTAGTSYKVLELIGEYTDYDTGRSFQASNLYERIAHEVGVSEESLKKRIYSLREEKGFLVGEFKTVDSAPQLVSLRLTPEGIDHIDRTREDRREKEGLLDDDEVWELEMKTGECIELARSLGRTSVAKSLKWERDNKHLFEMTHAEFADEVARIAELHEQLQSQSPGSLDELEEAA